MEKNYCTAVIADDMYYNGEFYYVCDAEEQEQCRYSKIIDSKIDDRRYCAHVNGCTSCENIDAIVNALSETSRKYIEEACRVILNAANDIGSQGKKQ